MSKKVAVIPAFVALDKATQQKQTMSIRGRGVKLKAEMHRLIVGWAMHYVAHGDYTMLQAHTETVGIAWGSSMVKAMNDWIKLSVNGLVWNDEIKAWEHVKGAERSLTQEVMIKDKKGNVKFSGDPRNLSFFDLEIPKDPAPFDLIASFDQLLKRAESAAEKAIGTPEYTDLKARIDVLKSLNLPAIHALPANDVSPEKEKQEIAAILKSNGRAKRAAKRA